MALNFDMTKHPGHTNFNNNVLRLQCHYQWLQGHFTNSRQTVLLSGNEISFHFISISFPTILPSTRARTLATPCCSL